MNESNFWLDEEDTVEVIVHMEEPYPDMGTMTFPLDMSVREVLSSIRLASGFPVFPATGGTCSVQIHDQLNSVMESDRLLNDLGVTDGEHLYLTIQWMSE